MARHNETKGYEEAENVRVISGETMAGAPKPQASTILIVEDECPIRTLMEAILRKEGYIVWTASSGMEAIRKIALNIDFIDLLITDYSLPEMGGDDVAAHARELKPTLNVIFATGSIGRIPAESLDRIQGAVLLEKPFTPALLRSKVKESIENKEHLQS